MDQRRESRGSDRVEHPVAAAASAADCRAQSAGGTPAARGTQRGERGCVGPSRLSAAGRRARSPGRSSRRTLSDSRWSRCASRHCSRSSASRHRHACSIRRKIGRLSWAGRPIKYWSSTRVWVARERVHRAVPAFSAWWPKSAWIISGSSLASRSGVCRPARATGINCWTSVRCSPP